MIRVLFFGPVADRIGQREVRIDHAPGMTLHHVIARIGNAHPGAFSIVSFIAVNQQQVHDRQMTVNDGDEIAFMAKFSGG